MEDSVAHRIRMGSVAGATDDPSNNTTSTVDILSNNSFNFATQNEQNVKKSIDLLDSNSCTFANQADNSKDLVNKAANSFSETDEMNDAHHQGSDQQMEIEQPAEATNDAASNKGDAVLKPAKRVRNLPQELVCVNPALSNYFEKRLLQILLLHGASKESSEEWDAEVSKRRTGITSGILKVLYKSKKTTKVFKSRSEIIWSLGLVKIGKGQDKSFSNRYTGYFTAVERRERHLLSLQLELSKDQCVNVLYLEDCIKVVKPPRYSAQEEINDTEEAAMDTLETTEAQEAVDEDAQVEGNNMPNETNDAQWEADTQQTKNVRAKTAKAPGVLYNRWARKRFLYDFPELGKKRDMYKASVETSNSDAPPSSLSQNSSQPASQPNSHKLSTNDIILHIHGNYGILNWGVINRSVKGNKINYHNSDEIYPIGFKCIIIERDVICNKIVTLLLETLEVDIDGDEPNHYCNRTDFDQKIQFKITAVWDTDVRAVYQGNTPADVWNALLNEKKYIPKKRLDEYEKLLVSHNKAKEKEKEKEMEMEKAVATVDAEINSKDLDTSKQSSSSTESSGQDVAQPEQASSKASDNTSNKKSNKKSNNHCDVTDSKHKYMFRRFNIEYVEQNLLVHPGVMRLIEGMAGSFDCKNFVFKQHEGDYNNLMKDFQALQIYVKVLEKIGTRTIYIGENYPIVPLVPVRVPNQNNTKQSNGATSINDTSSNHPIAPKAVTKDPSYAQSTTTQDTSTESNRSNDKNRTMSKSSSSNNKTARNVTSTGSDNVTRKSIALIDDEAIAMRKAAMADLQAMRHAVQVANDLARLELYKTQIANQKVKDIQMKLKGFFAASHNKFSRQLQRSYMNIDRLHDIEYNDMHIYTALRNNAQGVKASIPLPFVISNSAACPAHVIDKVIQIYLFLTSYKFYNQNNIHAIESIPSIDCLIDLVVKSYHANSRSPDVEIISSTQSTISTDTTGLVGGTVGSNMILQIFEKICMALTVPLIPKFEKHVGIVSPTTTNVDDRLDIPINIYSWREIIRVVLLGEACETFGQSLRDEQIELLVKGGYDDCFQEIEFMEKKIIKYARKKVRANTNDTSTIILDTPITTKQYSSWLELLSTVHSTVDPYRIYNIIALAIKLIDAKHSKIIEMLNTAISPAVFDANDTSQTKQIVLKVVEHFSRNSGIIEREECTSIYDLYCRKETNSMAVNSKRVVSAEDIADAAMDLDIDADVEDKNTDMYDEAVQVLPVPLKRCYEVLIFLTRHPTGRNIIKKIYKASTLSARYSNFKMTFEDIKTNILTGAYRNPDSYVSDFYVDVYSIFDNLYYFTSPEGSTHHDLIVKLCNLFVQLIRSHVLCTHTAEPTINSYCLTCHESINSVENKKHLFCERCGGSHHASCIYGNNSNVKKGKEKEDWYCNICAASDKKNYIFSAHPYRKATVRHPSKGEIYGLISDIIYLNTKVQFIIEFSDESSFIWPIETVTKYLVRVFHSLPTGMSQLDYNQVISLLYGCDSNTYIPLPLSMHSNLSSLIVGSHTGLRVQMELFEKAQVALGVYGDYNTTGSDTVDGYMNVILAIISVLLQSPGAGAELGTQNAKYDQKINECAQIIHKKDKDTLFSDRFFLDSPELKACMTKSLDDVVQSTFRLASDNERDVIHVDSDYIPDDSDVAGVNNDSFQLDDSNIQVMDSNSHLNYDDYDADETSSQDSDDSDDSFIMQINEEYSDYTGKVVDLSGDAKMDSSNDSLSEQLDTASQQSLNQYMSRKNGIETALSTQNIILELFGGDKFHSVINEITEILGKSLYHFVKTGGQVELLKLEIPPDHLSSGDGYAPQVSIELVNFIMQQIAPINESMQKLDNEEWFHGFNSVMTIFEANDYSGGSEVCCLCKDSECSAVSPFVYGETYEEWLRCEYSNRSIPDNHQNTNFKTFQLWIPYHESYRSDIHDHSNACYVDRNHSKSKFNWNLRKGSMICHERCMEYLHNKRLKAFREMQRHHLIEFIETYTRVNFNSSRLIPFGVDHNNNMYFYINGSTCLYVYCSSVRFVDKSSDKNDSIEAKLQKGFANYITPEYTSGASNHMHWFVYEHLGDIGRIIKYLRSYCDVSANNRKLEKILSWLYPHAIAVAEEECERSEDLCEQQLRQADDFIHGTSNSLPDFVVTIPKHFITSSAQSSEDSNNVQWNNAYRFLALPSCVVKLNASPRIVELINFDSSPALIFLNECVRHVYEQPESPVWTVKLLLMVIFNALPSNAFDITFDDSWSNVATFKDSFIRGVYHAPTAAILTDFAIILETSIKETMFSDNRSILNTLPCRTRLLYQPLYSSLLYRLFCLDQVLKYKST